MVTCNCRGLLTSPAGGGTWCKIASNRGCISLSSSSRLSLANPCIPEANRVVKSHWSSSAPSSTNRSKTLSTARLGSTLGRSILLTTTIGLNPFSRAFFSTKRVWGIGPSLASTIRIQPSTIPKTRSTSPPKSA